MIRREFIRNAVIAAGALSIAPSEFLAGAMPREKFDPVPLRKSIMWNTIRMPERTVAEICMAVKAAGFAGVELMSHMDRDEVLEALKESGLQASAICNSKHGTFPLSSDNPEVRRSGIEAMIHAMEDASTYGTDAVLLVPGFVNASTNYEDCWKRSTECIKELIPAAKDLKVKICIENVWSNFLLSPIEAREYVDQFNSKWVKFYFDCGNVLKIGWPEHWINVLAGRIERIHIKEFSKTLENANVYAKGFGVKLGEGEVNWPEVMNGIKANYSSGWLTTEQGSSQTREDLEDLSSRLESIMNLI